MRPRTRAIFSLSLAFGLLLLGAPTDLVAQAQGTITGTVIQTQTSRPLAGVQVFLEATGAEPSSIGTITNAQGRYILNNVPAGEYSVRAQIIGHRTTRQEVTVTPGGTETVDFQLSESAVDLGEIVVSGAGVATERRKLGNTIATVNVAALEDMPIATVSELLQGREAGVVGLPSGGLTGEGAQIRIRGSASLTQSNEPIVYVDGIRVDNAGGFASVYAGGGGSPSRLDDINPESIERIEILKGAAAATLYGTEASNGVIQIFTKSGTSGAPRWTFQVEQGMTNYPADRYKPNAGFARDAEQAATFSQFAGRTVQPFEVVTVPFMERVFETGNATTMSGSVTGGNSAVTYFLSGRYQHEDGPFGGTHLGPASDVANRKQGTLTINAFPIDKLRIRATTMYGENSLTVPNNNNNIYGSSALAMFGKPETAFCNPESTPSAEFECISDETGEMGTGNPTGQVAFMTLRESMQQEIGDEAQHFNGSIGLDYELLPSVDLSAVFGVDFTSQRSFEFAPFGYDLDGFTSNNTDGFKELGERNHREVSLDAKSSWTTQFSPRLSSSLVVGSQVFHSQSKTAGGFGRNFPGPGLEVISAASERAAIYEFFVSEVNAGVFAQEQLGFDDWAFLTFGGRYDANSAFGEQFEGVFYPKASLSVIPSDMGVWTSPLGVSSVRLRAAIGQSGQQPGAFDKFTTFSPLPSSVGAGVQPLNIGNQDLEPEISTEWEIGADLGFFEDRISLDLTYWNRVVSDALMEQQFPTTGGFINQQLVNIGEVEAQGVELAINGVAYRGEVFGVDVFANASYLTEEVTDLGGAPPLKVGGSYPRYRNFVIEGYAPGALFGAKLLDTPPGTVPYDTDGDGQPDSEADFRAFLEAGGGSIGFDDLLPLLADEDGDGDFLDHYLGKPVPDWQGSFGFNIGFLRNFEISNMFEWKAGNFTMTNLTDAFRKSNAVIGRNTPRAAEAEAKLLNPASTGDERVEAAMAWANELRALAPYSGLNTMEKGDFLRWREAKLSYRLPSDFVGRFGFGITDASVTLSGRNIALWTEYSGIDPELNVYGRGATSGIHQNFGTSIDAFGLALPRRYQVAVRLGF